uniref:SURF1 family protein n=1 Tax=Paenirhodobacter enshiensis TaxID=1105367 RepID=UPI0035AF7367
MTYLKPRWPRLILVTLLALIGAVGFGSLGTWQVHRLHWKLDLIARVDSRVHADPVPAPGPADWPKINAADYEYMRVTLRGTFLNGDEAQVYTPTDWGPGYWVLTPLRRDDGTVVFVNRGLVPEAMKAPATRPAPEGEQTVTGLLRISETKGWLFSQPNEPAKDKWHLRDVGAIAAARGLTDVAPYFVDQEMVSPEAWPKGGQTVVKFRNAHLSYALTWYGLMLFVIGAWGYVAYTEFHRRPDEA